MLQKCTFGYKTNRSTQLCIAQSVCELFPIFHHRCKSRCFRFIDSHVVNYLWKEFNSFEHTINNILFTFFWIRLPFDWENPIGYFVAVALQFHMALVIIRYIECFFTLGLAGLIFAFTLIKDIKTNLKQFNKIAKNKRSKLQNIVEELVKLIRFDINLRELSL